MNALDLRTMIREVDDFPTPGVGFKDITPLLADPEALRQTIGELADWVRVEAARPVLGAEARGFILGAAIAAAAGCGFVPARRPGQAAAGDRRRELLPRVRRERRSRCIPDLIPTGARVVIHDDVLATGGTVEAICGLVERLGGEVVGACFIIELTFLGGRERLDGLDVHALITY